MTAINKYPDNPPTLTFNDWLTVIRGLEATRNPKDLLIAARVSDALGLTDVAKVQRRRAALGIRAIGYQASS